MIKIGCCGWGFFKGGLSAYSKKFSVVESQQTFYRLPMPKTAQRWREEVPTDFEFTCKAFQAITHPPSSPTWKRSGIKVEGAQKERYGLLKPTPENFEAWEKTRQICEILGARICVIQCPPKFSCTKENIRNMRKFFEKIDRGKLTIAWEPRGDWNEHPEQIRGLCDELELVHVVDPMRRDPLSEHPIIYFRLHGLKTREYDYNYKYSEDELRTLGRKLKEFEGRYKEVYCMFNNYNMYQDAEKLTKMLG